MSVRHRFRKVSWAAWAVVYATSAACNAPTAQRADDAPVMLDVDAGGRDAGALAPTVPATEPSYPNPDSDAPFWLSETGLYTDILRKKVRTDAAELKPRFPLWSDATRKRRWLVLPAGKTIDNRDPGDWHFPVGTLAFKEFRNAERRMETRLIVRTGPGEDDFWMGAFVWNEDESDARFVASGAKDVLGTQHDVPSTRNCWTCHRGATARLLGVSALQLPEISAGLLAQAQSASFDVPGDTIAASALGYLHGNCAHCHNPQGSARPDTDLNLSLTGEELDPRKTNAYRTSVGISLQYFAADPGTQRVVPGEPTRSALLLRMQERGANTQMPPLGTKLVDEAGIAHVRGWILAL